jgi:hypothetical protein
MLPSKFHAKLAAANHVPHQAFSAAHLFAHPTRTIAKHPLGQHGAIEPSPAVRERAG